MDFPYTDGDPDSTEKPWLDREEWVSGNLQYSLAGHPSTFLFLFFGILLLLIAAALAAGFTQLFHKTGYATVLPAVLAGGLGLALTIRGVRLILSWVRYGSSEFHLASVPVPLGGALRGELRATLPAGRRVRLKLQCRSLTTASRKDQQGNTSLDNNSTTVWENEGTVIADGNGVLQVTFVVPSEVPATKLRPRAWQHESRSFGSIQSKAWVEWWLIADDPSGSALGYRAEFELPVFRVPETAGQTAEVKSIRETRKEEIEAYSPGPDFKVRIVPTTDGSREFFFPPASSGANAIGQTVVFLITFVPLVTMATQLPILIVAVWSVIEIVFLAWILRLWFAPEQVVVANGVLTVTQGLFARKRRVATTDITSIHAAKTGNTRNHHIRIVAKGWRVTQVGDGIRNPRDAEWLARKISEAAGVKPVDPIPLNSKLEEQRIIAAFARDVRGGKIKRPSDAEIGRPEKDEDPRS